MLRYVNEGWVRWSFFFLSFYNLLIIFKWKQFRKLLKDFFFFFGLEQVSKIRLNKKRKVDPLKYALDACIGAAGWA